MPSHIIKGVPGTPCHDKARKAHLKELANTYDRFSAPPSATWALLWICDISNLRDMVETLKSNNNDQESSAKIAVIRSICGSVLWEEVVSRWLFKSRAPTVSSPLPGCASMSGLKRKRVDSPARSSTRSRRKLKLAEQARLRDRRCIVTKMRDERLLIGSNIFPSSITTETNSSSNSKFWSLLKLFWPGKEVDECIETLSKAEATNSITNILTMTHDVHTAYNKALFGLKPVEASNNGRTMRLQFFWLKKQQIKEPTDFVSLLETKPDLPANMTGSQEGFGFKFFDYETEKRVDSGDYIDLETYDPVRAPLPSLALLKMQWNLQRIAALCGGAESVDCVYNRY